MKTPLHFNPVSHQLIGPAGTLLIAPSNEVARRFLLRVEGQCWHANVAALAPQYGYCRQRYYQLLDAFRRGGLPALQPKKTGPKTHYRRTDPVVRQVLRYRFLDPASSPEVIAQKLRQTHFSISLRSVQRILADYGLQKKTLRAQSPKTVSPAAHPGPRRTPPPPSRRPRQPGTRGPSASG